MRWHLGRTTQVLRRAPFRSSWNVVATFFPSLCIKRTQRREVGQVALTVSPRSLWSPFVNYLSINSGVSKIPALGAVCFQVHHWWKTYTQKCHLLLDLGQCRMKGFSVLPVSGGRVDTESPPHHRPAVNGSPLWWPTACAYFIFGKVHRTRPMMVSWRFL